MIKDGSHINKSDIPLLSAFLDLIKLYSTVNRSDLMPPSIFRTPDFSNQFPFPLEVRKIGIPLYCHYLSEAVRCALPPFSLLRDFSFQNTFEHLAIHFRQSYLIWEVCDVTAIELSSKE